MSSSASATNEPMSRSRTLVLTTTRRLPSSRLTWFGPGANERVATSLSGMNRWADSPLLGKAIGRRLIASSSERRFSGRRTRMSKRRSPSNSSPASRPPMAVARVSWTSCTLRPYRAVFSRSMFTVSMGRPVVCSTLTSEAPRMPCSSTEIFWAESLRTSISSPNTLTATSARTPEISSLKRSWMGWENS